MIKGKNVRAVPSTNRNCRGNAKGTQDGTMGTNNFNVNTFLVIVDKLGTVLSQRLTAYNVIRERFGFWSFIDSMPTQELHDGVNRLIQVYHNDLVETMADEIVHFAALCKIVPFSKPAESKQSKELQISVRYAQKPVVGVRFPECDYCSSYVPAFSDVY